MKKTFLLIAMAVMAFTSVLFCCCNKQTVCDEAPSMSWTEYNSVKTVHCYFSGDEAKELVESHLGDTIRVTGYILDYNYNESPSIAKWYYLADTIINPEEPLGRHLLLGFRTQNWEDIPPDNNCRVYCKGFADGEYLDPYWYDVSLVIDKFDTIPS